MAEHGAVSFDLSRSEDSIKVFFTQRAENPKAA
jgi:hypothetical protein